jgi:hypothetical protein
MVTFGWILFDAAISARMMIGGYKWWEVALWSLGGLLLAGYAWYREDRDNNEHAKNFTNISDKLIEMRGFNAGAFTTVGKALADFGPNPSSFVVEQLRTELQKYRDHLAKLVWSPLIPEEKINIRDGLSRLKAGKVAIMYDGPSDCEQLARDVGQLFSEVGWTIEHIYSLQSKIGAFEGAKKRTFALLHGIAVSGGTNDLAVHAIRDVLSNALNVPVTVGTAYSNKPEVPYVILAFGPKWEPSF